MAIERVLSLRITDEDGEQIDLLAAVDGMTLSDVLRMALREYVERRKADPGFVASVDAHLNRQRKILLEGTISGDS